eukprot:Em0027g21a
MTPDLLAYMTSIMRASREYSGLAWAQYDTAYRRQAASTNNRRWAQINPSLYSICFTGRAQGSTPRCELCTSVFHTAKDCPFSTKTEMEKTLEAVLTACTGRSGGPSGGTESTEICRKWNNLQCSYQWCRYRHVCLACGGAHPLRQCQSDPGRARAAPPSQFGTPPSKKLRMYKYTADLLALDQCRPLPDTQCTHKYRAGITTPLRWEGWEHALRLHPDRQFVHYIVSGLREGFRVGFNYSRLCSGRVANMPSAREHPQVVREYLATECAEGRILGPLVASWADTIYVSRFGVIPKGTTGKWRLILDLSSPSDGSVNDGIDKNLCGLTYATVDQAVDIVLKLGRGALLAKIDIMHAYRLIPVHPDDHWLLGMHFEGATFMDTVLPFGLRSAPKLFNAIADSLEWICRSRGVSHIMHYLDDFLVLGAPYAPECANNLAVLRAVFDELGVPLAEHKTAGPTATLVFLGVSVDSVSLMLRLPEDKLSELRGIIQTWLGRKVTTVRELQSLVGKLENACKVVRPGRSFLRRMIELLGGVKAKRRPIRLNASFRSDLLWWHCFLASWNGVAACRSSELERPEVTVYCDASGAVGCAAWWDEGTQSAPLQGSRAGPAATSFGAPGLDISHLDSVVRQLFSAGLATSTKKTYKTGGDRYVDFCTKAGITAFPVSERALSLFAASLFNDGLSGNTAKTYLAGIRYTQIAMGLPDPKICAMQCWAVSGSQHNSSMLWAASCMCFFGFLRSGEIVVPSDAEYDASVHLSYGDVKADSVQKPSYLEVAIKASKTDPFRKGVKVYLGASGAELCPVAAILSYMVIRGSLPGPFFMFEDKRPLTRDRFVGEMRKALEQAGVTAKQYSGHSFRIGAATTAASCGLQDSLIKTLGRWESAAYAVYIRTPITDLCSVSSRLVSRSGARP